MTRKLWAAVLVAVALDALITGYGAVAAGEEGRMTCSQDHGTVRHHECVKDGRVLFTVPL
jgi:hypothetical protein